MSFVENAVRWFFSDFLMWGVIGVGVFVAAKCFLARNITQAFVAIGVTVIAVLMCLAPELFLTLAEQVRGTLGF
jgi:hypothetical protein